MAHPALAGRSRRRGRELLEARDPGRGTLVPRRAARTPVHERELDRAHDHGVRERGPEARTPDADLGRRRPLVPGLLGARGGFRPRGAAHHGAARRRGVRRERDQDLDLVREPRRLLLPVGAQRSRLGAAPRNLGAADADGPARGRDPRDPRRGGGALLPRSLPERRPGPGLVSTRARARGLVGRELRAPVRAGRGAALRAWRAHARPAGRIRARARAARGLDHPGEARRGPRALRGGCSAIA